MPRPTNTEADAYRKGPPPSAQEPSDAGGCDGVGAVCKQPEEHEEQPEDRDLRPHRPGRIDELGDFASASR